MDETEKQLIDTLSQTTAELKQAVEGMAEGQVDEETVRRIVGEQLEQRAELDKQTPRRGFKPDDDTGADSGDRGAVLGQGKKRFEQLLDRPAAKTAPIIRRDVEDVRQFQRASDRLLILSTALGVKPQETKFYRDEYLPSVQALDTATTAEGIEYVPTGLSADLIERVSLELRVADLFTLVEMPTQPFDVPGRAPSRQRVGKLGENTADTGQTGFKKLTPATRKVRLSAVKFDGEMLVSKEAEEDAIIAMLPFMEEELVDYIAGSLEDATENGDTTGTHMDSDTTAADDPRKNWDGLRKLCPAGSKTDGSNASLTVALLRGNRGKMGKYGVKPTELAHILSINSYIQLLADTSVLTMEKYGPQATILTGELAKADGVSVIVSEYVRTDLNATGVYDGTTTTRTLAQTVYRRGFVRGIRRGLTLQLLRELYAEYDQDAIIASTRQAFTTRFPTATEKIVAQTYNLAS